VAAKMGWNFEHLRAAMGHSDYGMLQRYVRLATELDLGSRADWVDLIASNRPRSGPDRKRLSQEPRHTPIPRGRSSRATLARVTLAEVADLQAGRSEVLARTHGRSPGQSC
jgi:hypothetical protein